MGSNKSKEVSVLAKKSISKRRKRRQITEEKKKAGIEKAHKRIHQLLIGKTGSGKIVKYDLDKAEQILKKDKYLLLLLHEVPQPPTSTTSQNAYESLRDQHALLNVWIAHLRSVLECESRTKGYYAEPGGQIKRLGNGNCLFATAALAEDMDRSDAKNATHEQQRQLAVQFLLKHYNDANFEHKETLQSALAGSMYEHYFSKMDALANDKSTRFYLLKTAFQKMDNPLAENQKRLDKVEVQLAFLEQTQSTIDDDDEREKHQEDISKLEARSTTLQAERSRLNIHHKECERHRNRLKDIQRERSEIQDNKLNKLFKFLADVQPGQQEQQEGILFENIVNLVPDYLEEMAKPGTFGGAAELHALAFSNDVCISVYTRVGQDLPQYQINETAVGSGTWSFLKTGPHYDYYMPNLT